MVEHDVGDYVYYYNEKLGRGQFGDVFRGHRKKDESEKVAVKVINLRDSVVKRAGSSIQKEIEISKTLQTTVHTNLVSFKLCTKIEFTIYLVMEFCNGGNLFEYLEVKKTLTKSTIRAFLKHIGAGLKFLHSKDIIHRDLKPENVLLNFDGPRYPPHEDILLKIADFGVGRFLPPNEKANTNCGSPYYKAPEVASGNYDKKVDLWSIGMLIYECLVGTAKAAESDSVALPVDVTQDLRELLSGLLKQDPKERFDCDQLMSHSFMFKSIMVSIHVDNRTSRIKITKTSSVDELYEKGAQLFGVNREADAICLYINEQPLGRGSSVEDAEIRNGSNIILVLRVPGGIYKRNQTRTSDELL